ncbi:PREDICTED: uncharacterized protein LOC109338411 [Lupinus angustifolius]|uniref:uncharacterized protein LOC109338411 n=1 Tax=Lupinus angustifolius TaxID=3871 RepID=UPI00092FD588|nr:PREDICTED: uncharacterized protein LOC109338411 [Lupinus angustifolius]
MKSGKAFIPWSFLDSTVPTSSSSPQHSPTTKKSFAQALKNSRDIAVSQLPQPCIKGDAIAIKIPEEDYQAGLQRCKNHLHGRLILTKGDKPIKFVDLKAKLTSLWNMLGKWDMISLGRGFYDFSFSSLDDMRRGIGTPISLDEATNRRTFGHFAKVLVDINLKASLPDQILVEREGFAFFVNIEYENLPEFCSACEAIGHFAYNCRKFSKKEGAGDPIPPIPPKKSLHMHKPPIHATPQVAPQVVQENDFFINLEIDNNEAVDMPTNNEEGIMPHVHKIGPAPIDEVVSSQDDEERLNTRVEDSLRNVSIESLEEVANSFEQADNDNIIIHDDTEMVNPRVISDIKIVGRLWADDDTIEEGEEEESFTSVMGFGNTKTRLAFKNICLSNKPDLVFLSEPMISSLEGARLPCRGPSEEFKSFSNSANLIHLDTRGASYTWSNRRFLSALTEKRLDRSLCNDVWLHSWNQVSCCTLPRIASDHHPILLSATSDYTARKSPFRFHKMWLTHHDCRRVVMESWRHVTFGCPMLILSQKLKCLKKELKIWNINVFGNIHLRVKMASENLEIIQQSISTSGPDHNLLEQEHNAQNELAEALIVEEEFWKEKSRINWQINGDRNTSFFHKITKIRQVFKSMSLLKDGDKLLTSQQEIATHVENYFKHLFSSPNDSSANGLINSVIPNMVSLEENNMLTSTPNPMEIKIAVDAMSGDGAPGPYGFGGCFYHAFWDIVGDDVCNSVQQFFNQGWILPNLNSNTVVLIPKHSEACTIEEFRPIALANFQFKIISKVIADRLASITSRIISPNQRGFIKDRSIYDCICLASEAINLLDHKVFGGNLAIKLDIKKAFDTMDWNFLLSTLHAFGFNAKFVNWISTILHSAKLSISVNGENVGFFSCKRGVRQGDPLSPLLFCIAEDVLSRGISKLVLEGKLSTISGPRNLKICSHAFYADDILVFCKGIKREILALKHLLSDYGEASGQLTNPAKCRFYSGKISARKVASLNDALGFSAGCIPFNYLGVPIFKGKPRKIHLQSVADRILGKLATWKGHSLSIMGRVELVRSVIQSMLSYSFHIYAWPNQLLKFVDTSIRNFIWSGDTKIRKLVTVAWKKVCQPLKVGGLGLKSIKNLNHAALLKLAWEMSYSNQEWATFYRQRFGSYNMTRYIKSSIWPGIKSKWHQATDNSIWIVGNGSRINFWRDNWLGDALVNYLQILVSIQPLLQAQVVDFIIDSKWFIPNSLGIRFPELIRKISQINISGKRDRFIWKSSVDGLMTLRDASAWINVNPQPSNWCKIIWSSSIPPSKSFTTWRFRHGKLPTDENLQKRGCSLASMCNLCKASNDNSEHIFLTCHFAVRIWNWLGTTFSITINNHSISAILALCNRQWSPQVHHVLAASMVHIINTIWFCRNQDRFQDKKINFNSAISRIKLAIALSGNQSKLIASNSMRDFNILRSLNVAINYSKAPKIVEVCWYPPLHDRIKINSDGAAMGSPGSAAGGALFRNHRGDFLGGFADFFGIHDALNAELLSAILAINLAHKKGWFSIWLESDSALVVEIFKGKAMVPWKLINKWDQCKDLLSSMNCIVSHIYREGNSCADKLANHGLHHRTFTWWNFVPNFLTHDFSRNRMGLPNYRFTSL